MESKWALRRSASSGSNARNVSFDQRKVPRDAHSSSPVEVAEEASEMRHTTLDTFWYARVMPSRNLMLKAPVGLRATHAMSILPQKLAVRHAIAASSPLNADLDPDVLVRFLTDF